MGVNVHRHADLTVAEHFLDNLGMNIQAQQHCGSTMPEIMKANIRELGLFQQFFELSENVSRCMEMSPHRATKNEIIFLPRWTCFKLRFQLPNTMVFEFLKRKRGNHNASTTSLCFGLRSEERRVGKE